MCSLSPKSPTIISLLEYGRIQMRDCGRVLRGCSAAGRSSAAPLQIILRLRCTALTLRLRFTSLRAMRLEIATSGCRPPRNDIALCFDDSGGAADVRGQYLGDAGDAAQAPGNLSLMLTRAK